MKERKTVAHFSMQRQLFADLYEPAGKRTVRCTACGRKIAWRFRNLHRKVAHKESAA